MYRSSTRTSHAGSIIKRGVCIPMGACFQRRNVDISGSFSFVAKGAGKRESVCLCVHVSVCACVCVCVRVCSRLCRGRGSFSSKQKSRESTRNVCLLWMCGMYTLACSMYARSLPARRADAQAQTDKQPGTDSQADRKREKERYRGTERDRERDR